MLLSLWPRRHLSPSSTVLVSSSAWKSFQIYIFPESSVYSVNEHLKSLQLYRALDNSGSKLGAIQGVKLNVWIPGWFSCCYLTLSRCFQVCHLVLTKDTVFRDNPSVTVTLPFQIIPFVVTWYFWYSWALMIFIGYIYSQISMIRKRVVQLSKINAEM